MLEEVSPDLLRRFRRRSPPSDTSPVQSDLRRRLHSRSHWLLREISSRPPSRIVELHPSATEKMAAHLTLAAVVTVASCSRAPTRTTRRPARSGAACRRVWFWFSAYMLGSLHPAPPLPPNGAPERRGGDPRAVLGATGGPARRWTRLEPTPPQQAENFMHCFMCNFPCSVLSVGRRHPRKAYMVLFS